MFDYEECIKNFENIFEDVKFTTNSYVRLKVLATLFSKPQNMKEITKKTKLSYSSVSSIIHDLELKHWVYREHNKYFLTNSTQLCIGNVLELDKILFIIDEFFNIFEGHVVDVLPDDSIFNLSHLEKAHLLESSGIDVYRTYTLIQNCLTDAGDVKCIMPFFYEPFFDIFNELISDGKDVEILVPVGVLDDFKEKSGIEILTPFDELRAFLLIVTGDEMILGFYKEDGLFDQNLVLTSKSSDSIVWANNLFKNFKEENKWVLNSFIVFF